MHRKAQKFDSENHEILVVHKGIAETFNSCVVKMLRIEKKLMYLPNELDAMKKTL